MGEQARVNGQSIKIGTCKNMYYLRIEDAHLAKTLSGNVDAAADTGLRFRLPFPDEDSVQIGHYDNPFRGFRLSKTVKSQTTRPDYSEDFSPDGLADAEPGSIQLRHEPSGLLLNVPCHHGAKLPEITGATAFWNGKGHSLELAQVKRTEGGQVVPVVQCRHCDTKWAMEWDEILDYVSDSELRARLAKHL